MAILIPPATLLLLAFVNQGQAAPPAEKPAAQASPAGAASVVPADLLLNLKLDTVLDYKQSKKDDVVVATLTKDAKLNGKVILPKKTVLHGYLRFLDMKKDQAVLGLEFTEAEFENTKFRLSAKLEDFASELGSRKELPSVTRSSASTSGSGSTDAFLISSGVSVQIVPNNSPGVGTFVVFNGKFRLQNLQMVWRTLPAEERK